MIVTVTVKQNTPTDKWPGCYATVDRGFNLSIHSLGDGELRPGDVRHVYEKNEWQSYRVEQAKKAKGKKT